MRDLKAIKEHVDILDVFRRPQDLPQARRGGSQLMRLRDCMPACLAACNAHRPAHLQCAPPACPPACSTH